MKAIGDAASPCVRHAEIRFDVGVSDDVVGLGFDGFSGEVFEARGKRVAKRFRHGVDEGGIWARGGGDIFSGVAGEELAGLGGNGSADVAVFADFADSGGAGFKKDFGFVLRGVDQDGAGGSCGGESWSFVAVGTGAACSGRGGFAFEPTAEESEFGGVFCCCRGLIAVVAEDVEATCGAERDDGAAGEFELGEAGVGAFENVALAKAHAFDGFENVDAADEADGAFHQSERADAGRRRYGRRLRQQRREGEDEGHEVHLSFEKQGIWE